MCVLLSSPYLFFIGIGDYAVIKDSYKGKEISYYVEKAKNLGMNIDKLKNEKEI